MPHVMIQIRAQSVGLKPPVAWECARCVFPEDFKKILEAIEKAPNVPDKPNIDQASRGRPVPPGRSN